MSPALEITHFAPRCTSGFRIDPETRLSMYTQLRNEAFNVASGTSDGAQTCKLFAFLITLSASISETTRRTP